MDRKLPTGALLRGLLRSAVAVAMIGALVWSALPLSAQTVAWVSQFGTSGNDHSSGVAADAAGNSYVVGSTDNDGGALPGQTSAGGRDAFVRKYDSGGAEIWTRQFGSPGQDDATGVTVDGSGDVYVAGDTTDALPGQTSSGGTDAYVRKYDSSGTEVWTRQFGTNQGDIAEGIGVDASGSVLVVGETFGTLPGQTSAGSFDAFIRKYDSSGTEVWTRQFGTATFDEAVSVGTDALSDAYVAGFTDGTLPGQTSAGGVDAFVLKFDSSGTAVWTRQFGTSGDDFASGAATAGSGNVDLSGWTGGTLTGQTSAGGVDSFVRQYDSSGTEVWTRQFGTSGDDQAYGVAVDALGNPFAGGFTTGTFAGETSAGGTDAFVRKFDSSGTAVWTRQLGTSGTDDGFGGVGVDGTGSAFVAGSTTGTFPGQTSAGGSDAFVAKVVTAVAPADLSLTKTDAPDPVAVGRDLTYTITATNNGPSGASGVTVTDPLPSTVAFVSASPTCTYTQGTHTVTCSVGALASGASATVSVVVRPVQGGTISDTATVSGNEPDPNPSNNSATATTTVHGPPNPLPGCDQLPPQAPKPPVCP